MFNNKKIKLLQDDAKKYKDLYFRLMQQFDGFVRGIESLKEEKSKLEEELLLWKEKYSDLLNKNIEIMESIMVTRSDTSDM